MKLTQIEHIVPLYNELFLSKVHLINWTESVTEKEIVEPRFLRMNIGIKLIYLKQYK